MWIAFPLAMASIFLGVSIVMSVGLMVVAPPGTSPRRRLGVGLAVTSLLGLFILVITLGTWLFPPRG